VCARYANAPETVTGLADGTSIARRSIDDMEHRSIAIDVGAVVLEGELAVPDAPRAVVVFAHGSGSGRHSPRNQHVAKKLRDAGLATLLFDLLTPEEEHAEQRTRHLRFDIGMLARRLVGARDWLRRSPSLAPLAIGYFGASTGAAAALVAAALAPDGIAAVVSRGGRPDLAGDALQLVRAPTLLIVGSNDEVVLELNRAALAELAAPGRLEIVPGAGHLFEEPGALDRVARLACEWFREHAAVAAARLTPHPPVA
jgi:dienelactone hydrolase